MSPAARRWLTGGIFGLLIGWAGGGVIVPALGWLLGPLAVSGPWLPFAALALQIGLAVLVAIRLAGVPDGRRRLGWGCLAFGGALLLTGLMTLLLTGVLGWLLGFGAEPLGRGEATAAAFMMMLGLPYALLCAALLVVGAVLLRRGARPALSPASDP